MFKLFTSAAVVAAGVTTFAATSVAAEDVMLPKTMVWTSYDLGAAGYVEASAMADALDKQFGTTVRIVPSGTAVGRMLPLPRRTLKASLLRNGQPSGQSTALPIWTNPKID